MQVVFVLFYLLVWGVPFNESFYTAFSARERVAIQGVAAGGMPGERRPPALEPCPAHPPAAATSVAWIPPHHPCSAAGLLIHLPVHHLQHLVGLSLMGSCLGSYGQRVLGLAGRQARRPPERRSERTVGATRPGHVPLHSPCSQANAPPCLQPAPLRSENVTFIFLVHPFDVGDTLLLCTNGAGEVVRHDVSAL